MTGSFFVEGSKVCAANGREPTLRPAVAFEGNALLNFVNGMLHFTLGSVPMLQMSIDRYYRGDTVEGARLSG